MRREYSDAENIILASRNTTMLRNVVKRIRSIDDYNYEYNKLLELALVISKEERKRLTQLTKSADIAWKRDLTIWFNTGRANEIDELREVTYRMAKEYYVQLINRPKEMSVSNK